MHKIKATVVDVREQAIDYLQKNGFFHVDTPESTLDNDIHPIFAYRKFHNLSDNAYENMKPGLRLASLYLQDPRVLQYLWYQMRSNVQPEPTTPKGDIPAVFYKPKDGDDKPHSGTDVEWQDRLTKLSSVMSWQVQASDRLPKDIAMAYSFPFEELRTTYTMHATRNRVHDDVLYRCQAHDVVHKAKVQAEMVAWCSDQIGAGWLFRPGKKQQTSPCVLLHSFFGTYFDSVSQQADSNTDMHKIDRLGARFLLAVCLVHEVAYCLNQYPELTCVIPDGTFFKAYANRTETDELQSITPPECGLS